MKALTDHGLAYIEAIGRIETWVKANYVFQVRKVPRYVKSTVVVEYHAMLGKTPRLSHARFRGIAKDAKQAVINLAKELP